MRSIRAFLLRALTLVSGRHTDAEIADELESHLALHTDENIRAGMGPAEARRVARLTLGGVGQITEQYRDRRGIPMLDALVQDVRHAIRVLRRNPGFTTAAVMTMALGIGANTAIFTVINAVILRPLPFPDSERVVSVVQFSEKSSLAEFVTWPDYVEWRDQTITMQGLGAAWSIATNLTGVDEPERLTAATATPNFFQVFGVSPQLGRTFSTAGAEDPRTVVLGHRLWTRSFGADRGVLGRRVELNGQLHTVVGVMPEGFAYPKDAELWVPLEVESGMDRGYHFLNVVGRLRSGASIREARAEFDTFAARAAAAYPGTNRDWGARVSSLLDGEVSQTRPMLLILAAAVAMVLLIACANVAALLVSRSMSRRPEMALRAALGASRGRIARQLLTESLVLALLGGVAGVLLASAAIHPLLALTSLPRAEEVSADGRVLMFAALASLATGLCFGLAPVLTLSAGPQAFTPHARVTSQTGRLRGVLVAAEVGLAVVLLAGAGLLVRSFYLLQHVETGFSGERVLTLRLFLPRATYPAPRAVQHYRQMIDRVTALPDVEAAAAVSHFPFSGLSAGAAFTISGRPPAAPGESLNAEFRAATPGYFRTMGIPFVRGRDFDAGDRADSPFVAIVNQATADRFFPGEDPLDRFVQILGPRPRRIVGVVKNIRHRGLDRALDPEIYVPHGQTPQGAMFLAVRARSGDAGRLAGPVRAVVREFDPNLPIASLRTWPQLLEQTLSNRRFSMVLLSVFGLTALALAIVGTYGVLSYMVSQRTKEIGIRMALGGSQSDVLVLVLREGMRPVVGGLLAGIVAALGATRALEGMLYGIQRTDPLTLNGVAGLLLASAFVATLIPARRAARVEPIVTLRQE